jgi:signal transduction histidine kinase
VRRMSSLVEDLLMLARLDADAAPAREPHTVDVRSWVEEVAGRYTDARVPVSLRDIAPVVVSGQPDELRRALANLVDNAVRHASTRVEVRAYEDGPAVAVSVSDDGSGIPAAERERVFERFTRLEPGRGLGLGLYIARQLARAQGGDLLLTDARHAAGARFELRLPLRRRASPQVPSGDDGAPVARTAAGPP